MKLVAQTPADLQRLLSVGGRLGLRQFSLAPSLVDATAQPELHRLAQTIERDLNVCGCVPAAIAVAMVLAGYVAALIAAPDAAPASLAARIGWGFGLSLTAALCVKLLALALAALRIGGNVRRLQAALRNTTAEGSVRLPLTLR